MSISIKGINLPSLQGNTKNLKEEQFLLLLNSVPALISYVDKDLNYRFINSSYEKWFKEKPEDIAGKNVIEVLGEAGYQNVKTYMDRVLLGETVSFESEINYPFGNRFINATYTPDFDGQGKIRGFIALVNDNTEQKKTQMTFEKAVSEREQYLMDLIESETRYRQIAEGFPVAFYTCDASGLITFYNSAAAKLWGREPEIGKDLWCGSWKIFKTDGTPLPLDSCPMGIAIKEGKAIHGEEIVVERPDGLRCNVRPHPQPIFDSKGNITGAFNVLVDISKYKESEKALLKAKRELEKSAEQLQMILEAIPQMAWTNDVAGNLTYFNKTWGDFMSLEDIKNVKSFGHVHKDDKDQSLRKWNEAISKGEPFEVEYRWKRNDGVYRWMLGRANPVKSSTGAIAFWVGTATDIHEQKAINEQKDEFIGIASHELKTPLTSIKAYIQLLECTLENTADETPRHYIQKANKHINNLHNLISDLLDVSKIQAGKLTINVSELDFDDFVQQNVESIQHMNTTHKVILKGRTSVKIKGDKQRLEQVFSNYISNAIKYSPGAEKVTVTVSADDKNVQVAVTDYGIGIPAGSIKKVFERFYRVENNANKFEGLGLGLHICADIIEKHKGKVWVESEVGKGSTFYFSIPINI